MDKNKINNSEIQKEYFEFKRKRSKRSVGLAIGLGLGIPLVGAGTAVAVLAKNGTGGTTPVPVPADALTFDTSNALSLLEPTKEKTEWKIKALDKDEKEVKLTSADVENASPEVAEVKFENKKFYITPKTNGDATIKIRNAKDSDGKVGNITTKVYVRDAQSTSKTLIVDATRIPKIIAKDAKAETVDIKATYSNGVAYNPPFEVLQVTARTEGVVDITPNKTDGTVTITPAKDAKPGASTNIWVQVMDKDNNYGAASVSVSIQTEEQGLVKDTYDNIAKLAEANKLVAGKQYQITDYSTTVNTQFYPGIAGVAGHPFDIIVTATSSNTFNENAMVVNRGGDKYFEKSKLNGWTVKYSFENDEDRFDWASETGKGVIYYMRDEFGNEAPYDFKNILFQPVGQTGAPSYYTFDINKKDASLAGRDNLVYNNTIKEYSIDGTLALNNIVFEGRGCYGNDFDNDCYDMFIGEDSHSNHFGEGCDSNLFGSNVSGNMFGNFFRKNKIGNYVTNNTFGNDCKNIIINYSVPVNDDIPTIKNNTFGDGISNIVVNPNINFFSNSIFSTVAVSNPLTVTVDVHNKFIINGQAIGEEEQYTVGDVEFDKPFNKGTTSISTPLSLTSWYGDVPNVKWEIDSAATSSTVKTVINVDKETGINTLQVTPTAAGGFSVFVKAIVNNITVATKVVNGNAAATEIIVGEWDKQPNVYVTSRARVSYNVEQLSVTPNANYTLSLNEKLTSEKMHAQLVGSYISITPDDYQEGETMQFAIDLLNSDGEALTTQVFTPVISRYKVGELTWKNYSTGDPLENPIINTPVASSTLTLYNGDEEVSGITAWNFNKDLSSSWLYGGAEQDESGNWFVGFMSYQTGPAVITLDAYQGDTLVAQPAIILDIQEGYDVSEITWDQTPRVNVESTSTQPLQLTFQGSSEGIDQSKVQYQITDSSYDLNPKLTEDKHLVIAPTTSGDEHYVELIVTYNDVQTSEVYIEINVKNGIGIEGTHSITFSRSYQDPSVTSTYIHVDNPLNETVTCKVVDKNDPTQEVSWVSCSEIPDVDSDVRIEVTKDAMTQAVGFNAVYDNLQLVVTSTTGNYSVKHDLQVCPYGLNEVKVGDTTYNLTDKIGLSTFVPDQDGKITFLYWENEQSTETMQATINYNDVTDITLMSCSVEDIELPYNFCTAYTGSSSLKTLNLKGCVNVTKVKTYVLNGNPNLTSVNFNGLENVKTLEDNFFQGSGNATDGLDLDMSPFKNLQWIYSKAFMGSYIKTLNLNCPSLRYIYSSFCVNCSKLISLDMSKCINLVDVESYFLDYYSKETNISPIQELKLPLCPPPYLSEEGWGANLPTEGEWIICGSYLNQYQTTYYGWSEKASNMKA